MSGSILLRCHLPASSLDMSQTGLRLLQHEAVATTCVAAVFALQSSQFHRFSEVSSCMIVGSIGLEPLPPPSQTRPAGTFPALEVWRCPRRCRRCCVAAVAPVIAAPVAHASSIQPTPRMQIRPSPRPTANASAAAAPSPRLQRRQVCPTNFHDTPVRICLPAQDVVQHSLLRTLAKVRGHFQALGRIGLRTPLRPGRVGGLCLVVFVSQGLRDTWVRWVGGRIG